MEANRAVDRVFGMSTGRQTQRNQVTAYILVYFSPKTDRKKNFRANTSVLSTRTEFKFRGLMVS